MSCKNLSHKWEKFMNEKREELLLKIYDQMLSTGQKA
jgi:hypothetical protein